MKTTLRLFGFIFVVISFADTEASTIFCYYSSSASGRKGIGKFLPHNIDVDLCTHVIFAFADILESGDLKASNWNDLPTASDPGLYQKTTSLKDKNPSLKVILAVGGWVAGSLPFTAIVNEQQKMWRFATNVIQYLRKYNFDGLDLDWEFPATRGSPPEDKYRFTALLKEIQRAFGDESRRTGKPKLLLTVAAAGGSYFIKKAYETSEIVKYVDYLLLMTYNYHGSWNKFVGHHSGLYGRHEEQDGEREWNQAWSIDYWLRAGTPPSKLIVGIPTYGMSFTLKDPRNHGLKAPAVGGGKRGPYTQEEGTLAYYEICEKLENGWQRVWNDEQKVPYAYKGDQWVGYDNEDSVTHKARHIVELGLAGAFIWSVELDDFRGTCGAGKYPLLSTISRVLQEGERKAGNGRPDQYRVNNAPSDIREDAKEYNEEVAPSAFEIASRYGKPVAEVKPQKTHHESRYSPPQNKVHAERSRAMDSVYPGDKDARPEWARKGPDNNDDDFQSTHQGYTDTRKRLDRAAVAKESVEAQSWQYNKAGHKCTKTGLFADSKSCSSYYICVPHKGRWYNFRLRCPNGFSFKTMAGVSGCSTDINCWH